QDMDIKSQEKYLLQRLNWVHPVGLGQAQPNLGLTGIKIEERFEVISNLRVFQTLEEQPNAQQLLKEFNYPPCVKDFFAPAVSNKISPVGSKKCGEEPQRFPVVIQNLLPEKK